jgi:hypothetical protein
MGFFLILVVSLKNKLYLCITIEQQSSLTYWIVNLLLSSIGKDISLSRIKAGFDSRWEYNTLRGRAEVAYEAHNLVVVGSIPTPATNLRINYPENGRFETSDWLWCNGAQQNGVV